MPTANNSQAWPLTIKTLHWLVVLAVLVEVPAGFLMGGTFAASFHDAQILRLHILLSQIHHTLGFLLLVAGLAWLLAHWRQGRPAPLDAKSRGEIIAARLAHGVLGLSMLLIPWAGWTALSALEDSVKFGPTHMWLFGYDRVLPRIWTPLAGTDPHGYGRFASLHRTFLIIAGIVLAMHVASACWHHFARRDNVLRRIWPLG